MKVFQVVPREGIEPSPLFRERILSPQRLPFRHRGIKLINNELQPHCWRARWQGITRFCNPTFCAMTEHTSKKQEKPPQARMVKIGECPYRNATSDTYYALVKHLGRQIRRSLKTKDKTLAQRRLADFRKSVSKLKGDAGKCLMSFAELGRTWIEGTGTRLKASSLRRKEGCLKNLGTYFGTVRINGIPRDICEKWDHERGGQVSESSFNKEADVLKRVLVYATEHG
jgi:hypothetical protein